MQEYELARLKCAGEQIAAARRRLERAMTHLGKVSSEAVLSCKVQTNIAHVMGLEFDIRDRVAMELKGRRGDA